MLFQVYGTPGFGITIFDLIHYSYIIFIILMMINSIKQKIKHTIKITWGLYILINFFLPLIFGIGSFPFSLLWQGEIYGYERIYSPQTGWVSIFAIYFYGIFEPLAAILVTILSSTIGKKKRRRVKSLRAPSLIKTFPLDRELIFISYATVDSDFFQIPKLTKILTSYPEINEILYWESDMHDDIYQYMDENLKQCKVVLVFCSKNSLYSEAVKMEWRSALKMDKKIIPIFVEPDDLPALLSTKLGIQYNEDDPYSSIEDIYQMILRKLEMNSFREFTRFIIPKWITEKDFEEQNPETTTQSMVFDSDESIKDLGKIIALTLQENNFFVPGLKDLGEKIRKKKDSVPESVVQDFNQFNCFAELKDEPEDIALSVRIQEISESISKVFINARGKRTWVLDEILKDLQLKLIDLKSTNELLRNNLEKITSLLTQMKDVERFLRKNLGSDIKQVESLLSQYNDEIIEKEELIIKGTQLIGKNFITVFLKNIPLILKESKKTPVEKPPLQF